MRFTRALKQRTATCRLTRSPKTVSDAIFCYNILEDGLRTRLLEAFFVFEEAFDRREAPAVFEAFKTWNLELLRAFKDTGVSLFKTKILSSSFGQEIPMDELIKRVESIPLA